MTLVRWTQPANDDFFGLVAWIATERPAAAASVGRRILNAVEGLGDLPVRGRLGRSPDARELPIAGLPYLVVYSVAPATVVILRALHGAMLWPPAAG
jgi:toxin ParE1/3/4